jgi:hypothetical protein
VKNGWRNCENNLKIKLEEKVYNELWRLTDKINIEECRIRINEKLDSLEDSTEEPINKNEQLSIEESIISDAFLTFMGINFIKSNTSELKLNIDCTNEYHLKFVKAINYYQFPNYNSLSIFNFDKWEETNYEDLMQFF